MIDFEAFRRAVLEGAKAIARDFLREGVTEAGEDAEAFLRSTEEKMRRWTKLLATGEITKEEFAFLVRSQADLVELFALTRLGVGLARLQAFRNRLIEMVIDRAFGLLR